MCAKIKTVFYSLGECFMSDLREIIAKNICDLRVNSGMTQSKLAEELNYSDKAISKWERAESIPDVVVLKELADLFGVSVDYLLAAEHEAPLADKASDITLGRNRFIVSALAAMLVWLIATYMFIQMNISFPSAALPAWVMFIYALPISSVVVLVFNSIWGRRRFNYLIISVMVWSLILSVYLTALTVGLGNFWMMFFLGVPAQIIIILWSGLSVRKK